MVTMFDPFFLFVPPSSSFSSLIPLLLLPFPFAFPRLFLYPFSTIDVPTLFLYSFRFQRLFPSGVASPFIPQITTENSLLGSSIHYTQRPPSTPTFIESNLTFALARFNCQRTQFFLCHLS